MNYPVYPTICNVIKFYLFLEAALHVSGGISTHHQEMGGDTVHRKYILIYIQQDATSHNFIYFCKLL